MPSSPVPITADRLRSALALRDLTDPILGPHALQALVGGVLESIRSSLPTEVLVRRAHPIVSVADNFELLGYSADATARDSRYTRYVTNDSVLRTHMSAMIPSLLPSIVPAAYEDVTLACVGLVYRRDSIDRLHVGEPHQLDLWRIGARAMGVDELHELVAIVLSVLLPSIEYRLVPTVHPYTVGGLEVQARDERDWVEIAECGLASSAVLERAGMRAERAGGLAIGIGLDRVLMLRKGFDDIRLLRAADPRVARQMLDLEPYTPVSRMPPVRRDLSVAVAADTTIEEIGARVRDALGARQESVESIDLIVETSAADLPARAATRIGLRSGQKNVLLRVMLRHPTRTLTSREGNELRDAVYRAVHEGSVHQWADTASATASD